MKYYFTDTSVLLRQPYAPYILSGNIIPNETEHERYLKMLAEENKEFDPSPNNVVITDIVQRELSEFMKNTREREKREQAFEAFNVLQELTANNPIIPCDSKCTTTESVTKENVESLVSNLKPERPTYGRLHRMTWLADNTAGIFFLEPDNTPHMSDSDQIIQGAVYLSNSLKEKNNELIFITLDPRRALKANIAGLTVEDFRYVNSTSDPHPGYFIRKIEALPVNIRNIITSKDSINIKSEEATNILGKNPHPNLAFGFQDNDNSITYYLSKPVPLGWQLTPCTGHETLREIIENSRPVEGTTEEYNPLDWNNKQRKDVLLALHFLDLNYDSLTKHKKKQLRGKFTSGNAKGFSVDSDTQFKKEFRRLYHRAGQPDIKTINMILEGKDINHIKNNRSEPIYPNTVQNQDANNIQVSYNPAIIARKEHIPYLDMLFDDEIRLVTCLGRAGTGKTLLALAAGLMQILDEDSPYEKLIYTRPMIEVGQKVGYLPGDLDQKTLEWKSVLFDTMGFIVDSGYRKASNLELLNKLYESGRIAFEPFNYLRGRTLRNTFIVGDEIQSTKVEEARLIIGRADANSKIVFNGDLGQADITAINYDITSRSNGLVRCINVYKKSPLGAHITITSPECDMRGPLARTAEDI
ncbi:MAG: PhoH family protein [Candidatus Woesearchaeota archaeon]